MVVRPVLALSVPDAPATAVGAANTLWREGGVLRSTNTDVEGFIANLDASATHGVVTRQELLDAGISSASIKRRVRKGVLLIEYRGVYRVGHRAASVVARYLAAVRACPGPLYNRYNEGGYLIWLAPERAVFVDSRQDPYPADFVEEALRVEARGDYAATFARFGIRCAFLPEDSPTRARLARDGWATRFSDDKWTVLAAPGTP